MPSCDVFPLPMYFLSRKNHITTIERVYASSPPQGGEGQGVRLKTPQINKKG